MRPSSLKIWSAAPSAELEQRGRGGSAFGAAAAVLVLELDVVARDLPRRPVERVVTEVERQVDAVLAVQPQAGGVTRDRQDRAEPDGLVRADLDAPELRVRALVRRLGAVAVAILSTGRRDQGHHAQDGKISEPFAHSPSFRVATGRQAPDRATGSRVVRRDPVLVSLLPSPLSWWTTPQGGLSEDRSFRVKPGEPRPDQAVPELGPGDEEGVVVLLDQPLGHLEDRRKGGRGRRPGQREAGRPRQLRLLPRDHQGDA